MSIVVRKGVTASGSGFVNTALKLPNRVCIDVNGDVSHDCPTRLALGICKTENDYYH